MRKNYYLENRDNCDGFPAFFLFFEAICYYIHSCINIECGYSVKITILQTAVKEKDPAANHQQALDDLSKAPAADLLLLPELFISGYSSSSITSTALQCKELTESYRRLAKTKQTAILAGSLAYQEEGKIYNRAQFIDSRGEIAAHYDKIHLFRLLDEDKYFAAGSSPVYLDYLGWRIGIITCYDLRFPELTRLLALAGCNLLLIPAAWPHNRISVFQQLAIARAIENQLWVVGVNRASQPDKITYGGNSLIIAPDGEIIKQAGIYPETISAEIDLQRVIEYRKNIPCYDDRRTDVYKLE